MSFEGAAADNVQDPPSSPSLSASSSGHDQYAECYNHWVPDLDDDSLSEWGDEEREEPGEDQWAPFGSKMVFLASVLINQQKQPLSDSFLAWLWVWLRWVGLDMPPISAVRRVERKVFPKIISPPARKKSSFGNVFYHNSVQEIVRNELGNPHVRAALKTMPEDTGAAMSELFQGSKWKESWALRTPMVKVRGISFFVDEFVLLTDGTIVRISSFISVGGVVHLRSFPVCALPWDADQLVFDEGEIRVPITEIRERVLIRPGHRARAGLRLVGGIHRVDEGEPQVMPYAEAHLDHLCVGNPLREAAAGRNVVNVPLILFCDDMSGNMTKRWNPHESWYCTLGGLPFAERMKEYHVHFLATSNVCTGIEMAEELMADIE